MATQGMADRLPERLSPSRAKDFLQCPRKFYYKTVLRLAEPPSLATTTGTLAHTAFERVFDHPRGERTADRAVSYLAPAWAALTSLEPPDGVEPGTPEAARHLEQAQGYRTLAPAGSEAERELLERAELMVRNWFSMEDPNRFDPEGRELHLQARVLGVTLHGIIDRLDKHVTPTGEIRWYVSDYKTGKLPSERFLDEAFFAMKVYALLVREAMGVVPFALRLVHVVAGDRTGIFTLQVTEEMLEATRRKMDALWKEIVRSARKGEFPTRTSKLCDWCFFKDICPAWAPELQGMVAEETDASDAA